jgi:hypothetical protein
LKYEYGTSLPRPFRGADGGAEVQGRTGVRIAWATLAVYWGLVSTGFALRAVNGSAVDFVDELVPRVAWGAYPTVGALIVARQPRNPVGWLCCAVGLLLGPAFLAKTMAGMPWSTSQAPCREG